MNRLSVLAPVIRGVIGILAAAVFVTLAGCSTARTLDRAIGAELGTEGPALRPLQVPFAQLQASVNGGAMGQLFLARRIDNLEQWMDVEGRVLWMDNGSIVASAGLRDDLVRVWSISDGMTIATMRGDAPGTRREGEVLYVEDAGSGPGMILETEIVVSGAPTPTALSGQVFDLQRMQEEVFVPATGERWTNEYWVDAASGSVLIARQTLPGTGYVVRWERLLPDSRR